MSASATLQIIPAIDLRGGQAVRLVRGDFGAETKVADDPVAVAARFAEAGAKRLHVVDLDGARTGERENLAVIERILGAVPQMAVQVAGGIRSVAAAEQLLALGAARVVAGTAVAENASFARELLAAFGERVIVGADVSNGLVAVHGWTQTTNETAAKFGRRMRDFGAKRLLFTDVSRDGMLTGVNAAATRELAEAVGIPVLASGGVAGIEDIQELVAVQPFGVEGVIIGKALYAGRLTLADALRVAAGG